MKRHLPFIIASVLCLPFCAFVAIYLVVLACTGATGFVPEALAIPFNYGFQGLWWLSMYPLVGLPVLASVSVAVVAVWFQRAKTRLEIVLTSVYSIVMALYLGYELWLSWSHAPF